MEYEMENRALQSSHVKHIYGHIKINTRKVCATIGYKVLIFWWATAFNTMTNCRERTMARIK